MFIVEASVSKKCGGSVCLVWQCLSVTRVEEVFV